MTDARIDYEEDDKGRVRPVVIGGNGEVQARLEWYDNKSNADRGLRDLWTSIGLAANLIQFSDAEEPEDAA